MLVLTQPGPIPLSPAVGNGKIYRSRRAGSGLRIRQMETSQAVGASVDLDAKSEHAPLRTQLTELEESLKELDDNVASLVAELDPVLRTIPDDPGKAGSGSSAHSQLADRVENAAQNARRITAVVIETRRRLDL